MIVVDRLTDALKRPIKAQKASAAINKNDAVEHYKLMDEHQKLLKKQGFTKKDILAKS